VLPRPAAMAGSSPAMTVLRRRRACPEIEPKRSAQCSRWRLPEQRFVGHGKTPWFPNSVTHCDPGNRGGLLDGRFERPGQRRASATRFAFLACLSMQQAQDHWSQQRFLQPVENSRSPRWAGGRRTIPAFTASSQPVSSKAARVRSRASSVSVTKSLGPNVR
jgi:hypothetical protein